LATPNYGYEKRQKELAKKRKKEEKLKARAERKTSGEGDGEGEGVSGEEGVDQSASESGGFALPSANEPG
jgi:hypothetical protein